jgi:hypothetical protein
MRGGRGGEEEAKESESTFAGPYPSGCSSRNARSRLSRSERDSATLREECGRGVYERSV